MAQVAQRDPHPWKKSRSVLGLVLSTLIKLKSWKQLDGLGWTSLLIAGRNWTRSPPQ